MKDLQSFENVLTEIPIIRKKLEEFESFLKYEMSKYKDSIFYDSVIYALEGGKRIRPLILILSSQATGFPEKEPLSAALAIELVHTVSLVHDDIIDKEEFRRGKPAYHVTYGLDQSLLLADFALSVVVDLINKYGSKVIFSIISDAVKKMSEGELYETKIRDKNAIEVDEYLFIIENKTSSLFEASAKIGAILSTKNENYISNMAKFGKFLGMAYQIYDDIRDWEAKEYVRKIKADNIILFLKDKVKFFLNESNNFLNKIPDSEAKSALQYFIDIILKYS